jgi:hypothetical protein
MKRILLLALGMLVFFVHGYAQYGGFRFQAYGGTTGYTSSSHSYVSYGYNPRALGGFFLTSGISINIGTGCYYYYNWCRPYAPWYAAGGFVIGTSFTITGIVLLATDGGTRGGTYHGVRRRHYHRVWREF